MDLKPVTGFRLGVTGINPAHYRRWRAVMQPTNQLLDGGFFSGEMRLDTAVGAIADPTRNPQLIGLILSPAAEEDALHPARHTNKATDTHGYSRVRSGASSAFIPTTL